MTASGVARVGVRNDAERAGRGWRVAAYAWGCLAALCLSYFVYRIPVQLTDSLANLFAAQEMSWRESVAAGIGAGYLRPALWMQIKGAYVLAGGAYTEVFRSIHVLQILACALLFVRALRVRDAVDAAVVPLGLAIFFGGHTFDGTIREAFPVNTYLTVVLACLLAVNLSFGPPARWRDAAALLLLATMLFTVESGGLVFICLGTAWLAGARGVSARAVVASVGLVFGYAALRFLVLDVGTPGLLERPSGFGLGTLEPQALQARFGEWPYGFYLYNVASQVLTVLLSEPRTGVWAVTRAVLADQLTAGQILAVATSAGATALIVRHLVVSAPRWRTRQIESGDALVLVFLAVLGANAIVSFPYTKDVIVSPAGALFALATAAATAGWVRQLHVGRPLVLAAASVFLLALAAGWTVRLVGMHYDMRDASFVTRNDWTEVESWARRNRVDIERPARAALVRQLRDDAIARRVPAPTFTQPQLAPYFY